MDHIFHPQSMLLDADIQKGILLFFLPNWKEQAHIYKCGTLVVVRILIPCTGSSQGTFMDDEQKKRIKEERNTETPWGAAKNNQKLLTADLSLFMPDKHPSYRKKITTKASKTLVPHVPYNWSVLHVLFHVFDPTAVVRPSTWVSFFS